MLRALQMLLSPFGAWQSIAAANKGPGWAFFSAFLPFTALGLAVEWFSLQKFGFAAGEFGKRVTPDALRLQQYIGAEAGLLLAVLLLGAFLIHAVAESFGTRGGYGSSVLLLCYSMGGLAVGRLLDGIPDMPTWAAFGIGAVLMVRSLYHGVGFALQPDQTKGFGILIVASVTTVLLAGLAHFMAVAVLVGRGGGEGL